jgi:membrane complex biogenesis BtpA family protein
MSAWLKLLKKPKVVIGMLHLPALPGSPNFEGSLQKARDVVLRDLESLQEGGVHAFMMENFCDVPFASARVGAETVAAMTVIASDVQKSTNLPLGINVLRNDGESALAIAHAVEAAFIRVNILSGCRVTDQGVIQGIAYDLLRLRARLGAKQIAIMADVDVKHSAPLAVRALSDEVEDTVKRGLADAVIVSGAGTGKKTDPSKVQQVAFAAGSSPVFLGSGVTSETLGLYSDAAKGFIVGTAFKKDGLVGSQVDVKRVKRFIEGLSKAKH